jgi:hypothetical protein
MDKWFKDILPDKDPYHNRGRDQMRKKGVRTSSACDLRCAPPLNLNPGSAPVNYGHLKVII